MKIPAMFAVATGLALVAPICGVVPAQVVLQGQLNGFLVEAQKAEVKFEVEQPKDQAPIEKGEVAAKKVPYVRTARKLTIKPEVNDFVNQFLPQFAPPPDDEDDKKREEAQIQRQKQLAENRKIQNDQRARQLVENLRPVLQSEMRLLTEIASPSADQRREIAMAGGRATREAADKMTTGRRVVQKDGRRIVESANPRKIIQDGLVEAVKAKLPSETAERYVRELQRQMEREQDATILTLVANLDRMLLLTTDQREKLVASLRTHRADPELPSFETTIMYDSNNPDLPNDWVVPILTPPQQEIWKTAQKIQFAAILMGNMNGFANGVIPQVNEVDADVTAALAPEEVKP